MGPIPNPPPTPQKKTTQKNQTDKTGNLNLIYLFKGVSVLRNTTVTIFTRMLKQFTIKTHTT